MAVTHCQIVLVYAELLCQFLRDKVPPQNPHFIGGYNDEGVEEPLKITFVYKTGIHSNFNGKDFKPKRKNAAAVHNDAELCSYTSTFFSI